MTSNCKKDLKCLVSVACLNYQGIYAPTFHKPVLLLQLNSTQTAASTKPERYC